MPQDQRIIDGRDMTRRVLAELATTWAAIWDETIDIQRRNPDIMRTALTASSDPEEAIAAIIPQLALLHPQVARSVAAFCHAVADEFGDTETVSPPCDDPRVVPEPTFGGGQQHDRAAELETENAELRQQIDDLLQEHENDRACMAAALAALELRLRR